MQNVLVVVDMQRDFIDGALGTKEAAAIVPNVVEKVKNFKGTVFFTRDTHSEDYKNTQEGKNLPVLHCIKGTDGWEIDSALQKFCKTPIIDKPSFGSTRLPEELLKLHAKNPIAEITFVGLCTDICVISNVMITKAFLPEVLIIVDAACCAGVTPQSHRNALEAMKCCQVKIENAESQS